MIKVSPLNSQEEAPGSHPKRLFLVAVNKLGIVQTQFRLFSCRTLLLLFWSLFPLLVIGDLFLYPVPQEDPVFYYTIKACTILVILHNATTPSCLAYFFYCNPNIGSQFDQLPAPKRTWLFVFVILAGLIRSGYFCYSTLQLLDISSMFLTFFTNLLVTIAVVYDYFYTVCIFHVLGSVLEGYSKSLKDLSVAQESSTSVYGSWSHISTKCLELLNEYKRIKHGLGPLLLISISVHMLLLIIFAYITIKKMDSPMALLVCFSCLTSGLILFYLVLICDDCYGDLKKISELVR